MMKTEKKYKKKTTNKNAKKNQVVYTCRNVLIKSNEIK